MRVYLYREAVKPDIILISETKLEKDIKHSEFLPAQYTGHMRNDFTKRNGGVIIAYRNDFIIDEVKLLEPDSPHHHKIVWARLSVSNSNPIYAPNRLLDHTIDQIKKQNNKETIIGLNSNLHHITNLTRNNPST